MNSIKNPHWSEFTPRPFDPEFPEEALEWFEWATYDKKIILEPLESMALNNPTFCLAGQSRGALRRWSLHARVAHRCTFSGLTVWGQGSGTRKRVRSWKRFHCLKVPHKQLALTGFQKGSVVEEPPSTLPGTNQSPSKLSRVKAAGACRLFVGFLKMFSEKHVHILWFHQRKEGYMWSVFVKTLVWWYGISR